MQKRILHLFWSHAWRYPRYVIAILVLLPITVLMHHFLPPLIISDLLQRLSQGDYLEGDLWGSFGPTILLYVILQITSTAFMWRAVIVLTWKLEADVTRDLNQRIFHHLLRLSPRFHANHMGGSLVAAATRLTDAHIQMADSLVMQFIPLILSFLYASIILFPRVPLFVVCLLIFASIYICVTLIATRTVREKSASEAAAKSKQIGFMADSVSNITAVKSFAAENHEQARFAQAIEYTRQKFFSMMRTMQVRELYFSLITSSITSISIVLAFAGAVIFGAEIGTVFLIVSYSTTLVTRLWEFSNGTLRTYNRSVGNAIDMTKILELQPDIQDPKRPQPVRIHKGQIQYKNVTFTHADTSQAILRDFNLTVKAGEKIGLVGASGAGKSTLVKLLLRFEDIDAGKITIDGQSISAISQNDLRRHIAYVPQEPVLFHRTIRENIAYGRPAATEDDIVAAARKARALSFIEQLPKGFDTVVGERGVKLSGGQRQRIAIARSILKDAPILLLDEATSALDSESEQAIQAALYEMMQGCTTIAIAHRLSTIRHMDRIITLENGTIREKGSHEELLKLKGTYAKLWRHQSGGFLEDEA